MADNIEEEYLDNPTNSQSKNLSDEIIPTKGIELIKPNQETENMEVHHHPDLHRKPKKWKEYFLEFLMIFLAVTMGFIAENIREHFTETKIAHQNLEAYRNDLLQNEKFFIKVDNSFTDMLPIYDSIVSIFYEKKENKELPVLSRLLLEGQLNPVITINTPTYEQLISSGSLRFIDNKELKDSMANYQAQINSYVDYNDRIITTLNNQLGEIGKIEDMHDFWNRNREHRGYGYTPIMQPFSLSQEQRNFIIEYNKLFTVQALVGLVRVGHLLNSNSSLVKLIDKELNK